ncbi:MAG: hypothetical protein ABR503_15760, partial [Chitinophagaceae bacterium]
IDELAKLNLKPTDLIWVEGKSAGWRNPMEIDDLKFHLEDLSEQSVINEEYKQIDERETAVAVPVARESSNIKKPSKNIFVSLPEGLQPSVTLESPDSLKIPFSTAILDTEKVPPPLNDSREESPDSRQEPIDWKQSVNFNGDIDTMEVKEFEPDDNSNSSLNENRNYGDWRKQPRPVEKKVIRKKHLFIAIGLLALLAIGLIRRSGKENITASPLETSTSVSLNEVQDQSEQTTEENPALTYQEEYLPDAKFFEEQMKREEGVTGDPSSPVIEENKDAIPLPVSKEPIQLPAEKESIQIPSVEKREEKKAATDDKKDKAAVNKKDSPETQTTTKKDNNAVNKKEAELQIPVKKENAIANKKDNPVLPAAKQNNTINKKDNSELQTVTKKENIASNASSQPVIKKEPSVPLTQLIDISGDYLPSQSGEGVNGYKVTMQNNSKQVLKVVAVDVFYYADNHKLLNKKTLYFTDVPPKTNMILTAPANKEAVAVRHQLGLVSGEEGSIYFVKQ